jgi:sporulation protein YlmC with PRC-barrel domain
MKATNRLAIMAAIAALTVGSVTAVRADEPQAKAKVGSPEAQVSIDVNKDTTRKTASDRYIASDNRSERKTGVSDVHKASSIVGMKVKNQSDETLGNIEDLVVDMQSGRISYAVLGVGGFLGIGEKYIAVPPSAFGMGSDEKTLVLNADKAKLQAAPGFVKTNWPDYRNPDWGGEGFWDIDKNASVGGSASVTTGSDKSSSSREKKSDYKSDRDANKSSSDRLNK